MGRGGLTPSGADRAAGPLARPSGRKARAWACERPARSRSRGRARPVAFRRAAAAANVRCRPVAHADLTRFCLFPQVLLRKLEPMIPNLEALSEADPPAPPAQEFEHYHKARCRAFHWPLCSLPLLMRSMGSRALASTLTHLPPPFVRRSTGKPWYERLPSACRTLHPKPPSMSPHDTRAGGRADRRPPQGLPGRVAARRLHDQPHHQAAAGHGAPLLARGRSGGPAQRAAARQRDVQPVARRRRRARRQRRRAGRHARLHHGGGRRRRKPAQASLRRRRRPGAWPQGGGCSGGFRGASFVPRTTHLFRSRVVLACGEEKGSE